MITIRFTVTVGSQCADPRKSVPKNIMISGFQVSSLLSLTDLSGNTLPFTQLLFTALVKDS